MFSLCTCDSVLVLFTVSLQNDTHLISTQWNSLKCVHTNTFSFRFKRDLCPDEHFSAIADHWCEEGAEEEELIYVSNLCYGHELWLLSKKL